jgi:anaerobic magnesium-protoporphyrin IX monomethyl ester cyclase
LTEGQRLDLLSFHAYLLRNDRYQQHVMRPYPPLTPAGLASFLDSRGWRVDFFDPTLQPDETSFEVTVSERRPRVAALFGHPSTRDTAWRLVAAARRQGALVIAFGDDPTGVPELYLERGVDLVVRGEPELTVEAVLERLRAARYRFDPDSLRRIPGLSLRIADQVVHTPDAPELLDLDLLPPAVRKEAPTRGYLDRHRAVHGFAQLALVTSRGFPDTPGYRRRRAALVADEIVDLNRRFQVDRLRFIDHVFTDDPAWHRRLAAALLRRQTRIPYECYGHVQDITPELLDTMTETGCERIVFDVGTGSRRLLGQLDRGYGIEDVYRVGRLLRERDVGMGVLVSLGLEGETREDILATVEMLNVLEPQVWGLTLEDPEIAAVAHEIQARGIPGMRTLRHGWPDPERPAPRRLPVGFYRWALRLLAADTHLHRLRKQGSLDATGVGMALARPFYRAMVRVYPVRAR